MDNWQEKMEMRESNIDKAFREKFKHQFVGRKVGGTSEFAENIIEPEVSISEGWFKLMAKLCQEVDDFFGFDMGGSMHGFRWLQVKEKFGGLRAYYSHDQLVGSGSEKLGDIIDKYEALSLKTCDVCGEPGEPRRSGWILTRCDVHYAELLKERKERFGDED